MLYNRENSAEYIKALISQNKKRMPKSYTLQRKGYWRHNSVNLKKRNAREIKDTFTPLFFFSFFFLLQTKQWNRDVPRLGVESEVYLPKHKTKGGRPGASHICEPHHSSWPRQTLNPLSEGRDETCVLLDTSQIHFHWAMTGTPRKTSSHIKEKR